MSKVEKALRKVALGLSSVTEGVACEGTSLESRTLKVGDKAFLFIRPTEARLKLGASLAKAKKLAAKDGAHFGVGANGWVKLTFSDDEPLPMKIVEPWIAESYGLAAPKRTVSGERPLRRSKRNSRALRRPPR